MGARNTCSTAGGDGVGSEIIKRDDNDNDDDDEDADEDDDDNVVEELVNEAILPRTLSQGDEILEGSLKRTDDFGARCHISGAEEAPANEITSP